MKIHTIGGFNEVGKNMTVVETGEDAIILDAGVFLPAVIDLQEQEDNNAIITEEKLRKIKALPEDKYILEKNNLKNKIRAILPSHAHLDHVGALPYIAHRYSQAPIVGTPFTIAVLKKLEEDSNNKIPNKIKTIQPNSTYTIKGKSATYKAEFINTTHSTPQTSMIALHTPEGVVLYANDFKLDDNPILGQKPNYKALERIGKKGVKAIIVDSLYSSADKKTHSEKIARAYLEEVLTSVNNKNSAIFVATFSSHIARIKSIVDYAKKLDRKVFFLGRSLKKYISAAEEVGICPFSKDIEKMGSYKNQVEKILKKAEKDREKYLIVCTGHQGEKGSVMDRLAKGELHFKFKPEDNVIFASKTIPVPENLANKENLDKKLKKAGVRIFDNVHVSGHAGREDLRDLIKMVKPEHIIPAHGSTQQLTPMVELARELGYNTGKKCHLVQDTQELEL